MTNVHTRIERASDRLVSAGLRLKEMLADGNIDEQELKELPDLADALLTEAVEVEDVALDIAHAKQTLTLGRNNSPNRNLRERDERIELLKSLHANGKANGQTKAPTGGEPVEAEWSLVFESNR